MGMATNPPQRPYLAPPPPSGTGERWNGLTNTALGDLVEAAVVDQLGAESLLPEGKRQGPLDLRLGEYGFEVKSCARTAKEYKAKPKKREAEEKRAAAIEHGLKPGTMIVVVDEAVGYVYWREGIGAFRLTSEWQFGGTVELQGEEADGQLHERSAAA